MDVVTLFTHADQHSGDLEVDNVWFYTPVGSPKTDKGVVYTPMGGLPTIIIMVYVHFGCLRKLKVEPFTMVFIGCSK